MIYPNVFFVDVEKPFSNSLLDLFAAMFTMRLFCKRSLVLTKYD